jgi:hypothetical protein
VPKNHDLFNGAARATQERKNALAVRAAVVMDARTKNGSNRSKVKKM